MKNILLTIEYDGANFAGWQRQPNQRTVQGEIERALSAVCSTEIKINGTSRTDAGVHAFGQRANFKAKFGIPVNNLKMTVNNYLTKDSGTIGAVSDVRIKEVEEMPLNFHARFNAKAKTYIYKIRNSAEVDVFDRNYCYQVKKPLNFKAMEQAATYFEGTHDFKAFQGKNGVVKDDTIRTIHSIQLYEEMLFAEDGENEKNPQDFNDKLITMVVTGDGFLYNMVRIITGTLVDVGKGKIQAASLLRIIEGNDRQSAGHTAPPQGLYLEEVFF